MNLSNIVLTTTRGDDPINSNTEGDTAPNQQAKVADFLTVQSLTYSGALLAVGVVWALLQKQIGGDWTTGPLIPAVLAALLMAAGYLQAWDSLQSSTKRGAALIIAAFNAALLVAGAFGITTALN